MVKIAKTVTTPDVFAPTGQRELDFTIKDLAISPHSLKAPYKPRGKEVRTAVRWGQRKLHLSEVEFFTIYWDPKVVPNPLCVYAGAAPCIHLKMLSQMFPAITFHLYDTSPFVATPTDKVQIFKQYFTDETAARYANRNDVFFISDIRVTDYKILQEEELRKRGITEFNAKGVAVGPNDLITEAYRESEIKNEKSIWEDMQAQQRWVLIINPVHALLKFRLPYAVSGTDRVVQYLKGIVYWQPWAPQNSTETRLKPTRNDAGVYELADWSTLEYEQWNYYHNSIEREQIRYRNLFTGTSDPIDPPELLNDYDSVAEAMILKLYAEKLGTNDLLAQYNTVKKLSRVMTWVNNSCKPAEDARTLDQRREGKTAPVVDAFRTKGPKLVREQVQAVVKTNVQTVAQTVVPPRTTVNIPKVAPSPKITIPVTAPIVNIPKVAPSPKITIPVTAPIVNIPKVAPSPKVTIAPTPVIAPTIAPTPVIAPTIAPTPIIAPMPVVPPTIVKTPFVPPVITAPVVTAVATVIAPKIVPPTIAPKPFVPPTPVIAAPVTAPIPSTIRAPVVTPTVPTVNVPRVAPSPKIAIPTPIVGPTIPRPVVTVPQRILPPQVPKVGGQQ